MVDLRKLRVVMYHIVMNLDDEEFDILAEAMQDVMENRTKIHTRQGTVSTSGNAERRRSTGKTKQDMENKTSRNDLCSKRIR